VGGREVKDLEMEKKVCDMILDSIWRKVVGPGVVGRL